MARDLGLLGALYALGKNYYCRPWVLGTAVTSAVLLVGSAAFAAPCAGPGAPTTTQTKCLTAVLIPGNPLGAFDVSWVDPDRAEYYLADRSNKGVDIIDTNHNTFKRRIGGFVGAKFNANGTVNNNISGPNGVTSHGRWLYAGDGPVNGISMFRVIDLNAPTASATKQIVSTGGVHRVDKIALTPDGRLLIANNTSDYRLERGVVQRGRSPLLYGVEPCERRSRAWRHRRGDQSVDRDDPAIERLELGGG